MSTYTNAGQYVLEELTIDFANQGKQEQISLNSQMISVNLFESIHDKIMSGNISIVDTLSLNDIFPIWGNEIVRIKFHTAGNEKNPVEYEGLIYKISDKHRITEHAEGYTIYFCSESTILSTRSFVQKGYHQTVDHIVGDLYSTRLQKSTHKPIEVTPTKGITSFTFGSVDPLEAISILENDAVSVQGDHSYVFFENHQSYVFKPLQELYRQEPVAHYKYGVAGVYQDVENRQEESFERIQNIKFREENSLIDRTMDGLHGSRHVLFDLVTKKCLNDDSYVYNKDKWFDSTKSLGSIPEKRQTEAGEDTVFMSYGSGLHDLNFHKDRIDSRMKRIELEFLKAEMDVLGDSKIKAGDVLHCTIPNLNLDQESLKHSASGNYLITAIKHHLSTNTYTQVMYIQKDAYEDLPS